MVLPIREDYAHRIIQKYHDGLNIPQLPLPFSPHPHDELHPEPVSIGIIGAGFAGLYLGMELKKVNNYLEKHSLPPIKFEILEAQPASGGHPIGGRLWTHRICSCAKTSCNCAQSPNDYYVSGSFFCFPLTNS